MERSASGSIRIKLRYGVLQHEVKGFPCQSARMYTLLATLNLLQLDGHSLTGHLHSLIVAFTRSPSIFRKRWSTVTVMTVNQKSPDSAVHPFGQESLRYKQNVTPSRIPVLLPDMFVSFLAQKPRVNPHYEKVKKESEVWINRSVRYRPDCSERWQVQQVQLWWADEEENMWNRLFVLLLSFGSRGRTRRAPDAVWLGKLGNLHFICTPCLTSSHSTDISRSSHGMTVRLTLH